MKSCWNLRSLAGAVLIALLAVMLGNGVPTAQASPGPSLDVSKTASQDGSLVSGEITILNTGNRDATIDAVDDTLEVHIPPKHNAPAPELPAGSSPTWFVLAETPIGRPGLLPAGEQLVLPYSIDLCDLSDFEGANVMRNVATVAASDDRGERSYQAKSDPFAPQPFECPTATLNLTKVDQDGTPMEGVELQVTFPDGTVESCLTDADGNCTFEDIPAGMYSVDEPAPPSGYTFDGCVPDEDDTTPGAQITLADGGVADVTCTNTDDPVAESCLGTDACTGMTGSVGAGSCIGFEACQNMTGDVGDGACVGDLSCQNLTVDVPDGSCTGVQACLSNTGQVGQASCKGQSACLHNSGNIGDDSCLGTACVFNSGDIGNSSCQGNQACSGNTAAIGDGQCIGDNVCQNNHNPIP